LKIKSLNAFTLIEIMVVIVLIGILATLVMPTFTHKEPSSEWPNILDDLNSLILFARQESIANQRVYRLSFRANGSTEQDYIVIEEELDNPEKIGEKIYKQAYSVYFSTKYILPQAIKIKGVYIGKELIFSDEKGKAEAHVIPDGLVQEAIVNLSRKVDNVESNASFKVMPFFGKFEYFDGLIKPER